MNEMKTMLYAGFCLTAGMLAYGVRGADTYESELEYIESTGGQYIDTGVLPGADVTFTGKYEFVSFVSGSDGYDVLVGTRSTAARDTRYIPVSLRNGSLLDERYVYSTHDFVKSFYSLAPRSIVFNDAERKVYVDGSVFGPIEKNLTSATRTCWLFGANSEGKDHWFAAGRIYHCAFLTNGVAAREFIPVKTEDGTACMFDKVEGKLYPNLGTGSFIAGPLKGSVVEETKGNPWYLVEYLESDGNQWIDTGLKATKTTQTDVGYQYLEEPWVWGAMIGGVQSPSRYYPVSLRANTGSHVEGYVYSSLDLQRSYPAFKRHELAFNESGTISLDGDLIAELNVGFTGSQHNMLVFAANSENGVPSWHSNARIWHYDISEKRIPVRQFVPAVDTNGVACFYDVLNKTNYYNLGTGTFKVGRILSGNVPLDLSAREDLTSGLNVLPFTVRPSYGTVFTLDEKTAAVYAAEVRADGVYLVEKAAAGEAADVIDVTGETARQFKEGEMPVCASIKFSGTVKLTADCDWRGLGVIVVPDGVTIDLNGHDLQVRGFMLEPGCTGMFTDTTANGGSLRVDVPEDGILKNDRILLSGSLRFVKEGAGVFIAACAGQLYSGGTEIESGIFRLAPSAVGYGNLIGSENSSITVNEGAVFDIVGNWTSSFNYTLAGGTLMSSRDTPTNKRQVSTVTLTDDSVVSNRNFGLVGPGYGEVKVNLNGYTLQARFIEENAGFFIAHTTFKDAGTFRLEDGWFRTINADYACIGQNLTLELTENGDGLGLEAPLTVSNFYNRVSNFTGDGTLSVLGTFRPAGGGRTNFPDMILKDGATFDLSEMGDVATFATMSESGNALSFEDGATIAVALGERNVSSSVPLVSWTERPANLDTLTFVNADSASKCRILKKETGLYVMSGFVMMLR